MSCVYICDRCGKPIEKFERATPNRNGEYEIVPASRISLCDGNKSCDLCLECKTELYDWLHGAWLKEAT